MTTAEKIVVALLLLGLIVVLAAAHAPVARPAVEAAYRVNQVSAFMFLSADQGRTQATARTFFRVAGTSRL
jgi:hypothetical protein